MKKLSAAEKITAELNRRDISLSDRSLLISAVLDKVAAIPLRDIIIRDEQGILFVNGRQVTTNEAISLRESASVVLHSKAFQLIREQVVYASFAQAAYTAATPEQLMLGKAALWWGQQEDKFLQILSTESHNGNPAPSED